MAYRTEDHSDLILFKNRLWKLMVEKDIDTPKELAKELYDKKLVTVRQKKSYDEPSKIYGNAIGAIEKKIQKHLKADTAQELQGEFSIAYCAFFGCSSDYLFGFIDCKTHDIKFMHDKTGLSETSINKLINQNNRSNHYFIDSLNILLQSQNFENALFHIPKYMEAVKTTKLLQEQMRERVREVMASEPENTNDAYNWPYNEDLDINYKSNKQKMILQEYTIDKNFKYVIQELERIAKEQQ